MSSKQHFPHSILFDLDGTLIDTAPDVRLALNFMLETYQITPIPTPEIYGLLGEGVQVLVQKAFAKSQIFLSANELKNAIQIYLNFYKKNPVVETKIFPGVMNTLKFLKEQGIKMGICTNKPGVMTRLLLDQLNMAHFFETVVAGDEVKQPKPHAFHVKQVLQTLKASEDSTVFVGDSAIDQLTAKNAKIPFIGVTYGYDSNRFEEDFHIHHFSELPSAIDKIQKEGVLT